MAAMVDYATSCVAAADRVDFWREQVWVDIGAFEITSGDAGLRASAQLKTLGQMRVGAVEAHAHGISRSPSQSRGDDRQIYKIVFQHSGQTCIEQFDKRLVLTPGQWAIYDMTRPFSFTCSDRTRQSAMFVRPQDLRLKDLGAYSLRPYQGTSGYSALLREAVTTAMTVGAEDCADADVDAVLARLARLAILEHGSQEARRSSHEVMRERIDDYLEANLRSSELTIGAVASALNCSKRYLHKVFLEGDETLTEHILQRRLEACRRDLADPACPYRTLTELAYAWGFSSLAYFSRVFKQVHGMSPRDYRRAMLSPLSV